MIIKLVMFPVRHARIRSSDDLSRACLTLLVISYHQLVVFLKLVIFLCACAVICDTQHSRVSHGCCVYEDRAQHTHTHKRLKYTNMS